MRFSSYEDNQEGQVACGEAAIRLPHHSFASPTICAYISGNIFYAFDANG
ncbi:hypothetical protein GTQ43_11855 [Nostoc sp. KVJ3]|nr:hypothetical protein [Nostoc sp. KVJ3]MCW5314477.1 hypothetical protein [Nostoc sp. KVJ3]